jgi:hypothetical protein
MPRNEKGLDRCRSDNAGKRYDHRQPHQPFDGIETEKPAILPKELGHTDTPIHSLTIWLQRTIRLDRRLPQPRM